jgi:hypothetical protein
MEGLHRADRGTARRSRVIAPGRRALPALGLALLLLGCAATVPESSPPPAGGGDLPAGRSTELTMDVHSGARWPEAGIEVALVRVASDSRCAAGTNCIWAGNATLDLTASRADQSESFTLRFGPAGGSDGAFAPDIVDRLGFRFEVVQLEPQPVAGRTIGPLDYRARVRVTRL